MTRAGGAATSQRQPDDDALALVAILLHAGGTVHAVADVVGDRCAAWHRPTPAPGTNRDAAAGEPGDGFVAAVVARLLEAIGVEASEACALATAAYDAERHCAGT